MDDGIDSVGPLFPTEAVRREALTTIYILYPVCVLVPSYS